MTAATVSAPASPMRAVNLILQVSRATRGLAPLLLLLAAWQVVGLGDVRVFPPPSVWLEALDELHEAGVLWPAVWSTMVTFMLAIASATVLGAALGLALGASRAIDRAMTPFLDFCRSVPPPVVVPVATLIIGISQFTTVVIVVLAIIWPIVLNTAAATRAVPRTRTEVARVLQLTRRERITKVLVPSAMPGVALGFHLAVSSALIVTLLAEILGAGSGVGRLLFQRQQVFDAASVWGLLLVVGVLGFALNGLSTLVERRLLRNWHV